MTQQLYLDTSACRAMGHRLPVLVDEFRQYAPQTTVTTSMLTLVELLPDTSCDEREFGRRRSALLGIENASVKIVWRMPEAQFLDTFDWLKDRYQIKEDRDLWVGEIARITRESDSITSYRTLMSEPRLVERLASLRHYDDNFAAGLAATSADGYKKARAAFESATPQDLADAAQFGFTVDGGFRAFVQSMIASEVTLSSTLWGLAILALRLCGLDADDASNQKKTYESFNERAATFVRAVTYRLDQELLTGSHGRRNDGLDNTHFTYVRAGDVIVSADKKMCATANAIGLRSLDPGEVMKEVQERA